jgi:tetratricopeptide (TPR) repeat protein
MRAPRFPSATPFRLLAGGLLLLLFTAVALAPPVPPVPSAPAAAAQARADTTRPWQWPEKAENLKVLPENTTADQLRATMMAFTGALGVRCHHCHVGEEGQPFNRWDFASDEKPAKDAARVMMRMVKAINDTHLAELDTPAAERIQVRCITCHRGQAQPLLLEDLLAGVLASEGLEAALARYGELRQRHFGGFSYNFQPRTLETLATRLLEQEQPDAAQAFLQLNLDHGPESARTHVLFGEALVQKGDTTAALPHLRRAAEMEPQNQGTARRLKELGGS